MRENHFNHPLERGAGVEGEYGDLYPARHQRLSATQRSKFPLPKSPKVEIPMFKGTEDVLNWIYQMDHLFTIHSIPMEDRVEFCVFYLRDEALVWWRWLQRQKGASILA